MEGKKKQERVESSELREESVTGRGKKTTVLNTAERLYKTKIGKFPLHRTI